MSEICVVIVSPDDIGTTQVYLEVVTTENPDGVGSEASKRLYPQIYNCVSDVRSVMCTVSTA